MSRAGLALLLALAACGVKGPPRPPGQEAVRGVLPEPKTRGVDRSEPATPAPTPATTPDPTPPSDSTPTSAPNPAPTAPPIPSPTPPTTPSEAPAEPARSRGAPTDAPPPAR